MSDPKAMPTGWRPNPEKQASDLARFPLGAVLGRTKTERVERVLGLPPGFREHYDQTKPYNEYDGTNSCIGQGVSQHLTLIEWLTDEKPIQRDPYWLWETTKAGDPWPDTQPGDNSGTDLNTALRVVRDEGHVRAGKGKAKKPRPALGISEWRWIDPTRAVDEVRAAVALGMPVVVGSPWSDGMSRTTEEEGQRFVVPDLAFGNLGHCWLVNGALDSVEAVTTPNSWGEGWTHGKPHACLSSELVGELFRAGGQGAVVTSRTREEKKT
ncbi:MAG: hypothetical protein M3Q74_09750 [Pseudomonadota bacterium]|nr:hypothetical protein [Pseudomonadota bacterium]